MNLKSFLFSIIFILITACNNSGTVKKPVYVSPSIDYKGRFHKGHYRKPVSTDKNAVRNQTRSKYYYQTRGKYRRKKN